MNICAKCQWYRDNSFNIYSQLIEKRACLHDSVKKQDPVTGRFSGPNPAKRNKRGGCQDYQLSEHTLEYKHKRRDEATAVLALIDGDGDICVSMGVLEAVRSPYGGLDLDPTYKGRKLRYDPSLNGIAAKEPECS